MSPENRKRWIQEPWLKLQSDDHSNRNEEPLARMSKVTTVAYTLWTLKSDLPIPFCKGKALLFRTTYWSRSNNQKDGNKRDPGNRIWKGGEEQNQETANYHSLECLHAMWNKNTKELSEALSKANLTLSLKVQDNSCHIKVSNQNYIGKVSP